MTEKINSNILIDVFNSLFEKSCNTLLVGGVEEPIYLPGDADNVPNRLCFRADYLSSALHEIAHWCLAGPERRTKVDFGYWYNPDGRSEALQKVFERVEVKPQALEWHFSVAAGHRFHLSADNLSGDCGPSNGFAQAVVEQARRYCVQPLPQRAQQLLVALQAMPAASDSLFVDYYCLKRLI